ncbi:MAG: ABC transporter permease, partial [Gammaproteobacteria bacterium]|nr:ABC transporter permease [Gammaproteobacteria bacterium]
YGATSMAGSAVGLSLIWELGPVLTALMVIGRAGSAICAEISIMRTEQQIDALECMAIDPVRHVIVPRVAAAMISIPLLTAIFIVIGIMGGYFVSVILFGLSPGAYFQGMADTVLMQDLRMCVVKSLTFSLLIIWIATGMGYFLHLIRGAYGSEGVSQVTTTAVVYSSIAVLGADYLVSAIML